MGLLANNDRYVEIKEALEEAGIEVVSGEFHGNDQIKLRVQRDNVTACAFVPAKDKHDVGHSTPAAVASVRKALVMRGANFDAPKAPEPAAPNPPSHTRIRKKGKTHVVLNFTERADLYMLYLHVTQDTDEIMRTFNVSRNTVLRIVKEGNAGKFDSVIERPPAPTEATNGLGKIDVLDTGPVAPTGQPEVRVVRTKADLLNPKVLSIVSRANGLLDLLSELQKDGAAVGIDVNYKLKVEL